MSLVLSGKTKTPASRGSCQCRWGTACRGAGVCTPLQSAKLNPPVGQTFHFLRHASGPILATGRTQPSVIPGRASGPSPLDAMAARQTKSLSPWCVTLRATSPHGRQSPCGMAVLGLTKAKSFGGIMELHAAYWRKRSLASSNHDPARPLNRPLSRKNNYRNRSHRTQSAARDLGRVDVLCLPIQCQCPLRVSGH